VGDEAHLSIEEELLRLFGRLRGIALDQNPLASHRVSGPQLTLLEWVEESPGCRIQELADGLALTAPTVSVSVRRMQQAGLLSRQPDPTDGRSVQLFLTRRGRALLGRARAFRLGMMQRLLSGLAAEEQEQLLLLLERAVDAAEQD